MNSIQATHNQIALSAMVREPGINTAAALDTLMYFDMGSVMNLEPRREDNSKESTGYEEANLIYDNGALSAWPASQEKAQPQHFGFFLGYGLGNVASAALGDGYRHTITPIEGALDAARENPSFTAAQRYGKTITKRRLYSMFVDSFTATFAKDSWVKVAAQVKGTGKYDLDYAWETVSALDNVTTLTLAANGVAGSSAAERLANVQQIQVELTSGIWTEVSYSAVSSATPAAVTIASAGGAGSNTVDYRILYRPTEASWATFPSVVTESPIRVSQLAVNFGGAWTGSAFSGGRTLTSEINSLEYSLNNNGKCEFIPSGSSSYAGRYIRGGRQQKITLDREFRELIYQNHIAENSTFGIHLKAEGALFDSVNKYGVEAIFPRCAVLAAPIGVNDKRLSESVDVQILEDAAYGSAIWYVQNLVEKYAAAA